MQGDSHLATQYVQIVSEVIGLYKQQLDSLKHSGDEVFIDTLQKIVVGVEGLRIRVGCRWLEPSRNPPLN